jgi:hypothetical protein
MTRRSATALMLSMLVWLMSVIVVPNLSAFLASQALDIESNRTLRTRIESLEKEAELIVSDYEETLPPSPVMGDLSIYGVNEEVLVRLGRPERYAWLTDYYTFRNRTLMRYADLIWDIKREHLHKLYRQARLARDISLISPAVMIDMVSQNMVGSSLTDYEDFMEATREYRGEIISYVDERRGFSSRLWFTDDPPDQEPLVLDPMTFDRNNMDMERAWSMLAAAREDESRIINLSDMPRFRYYPTSLTESLKRSSGKIITLMSLNVVLFGIYLFAFSRMDVR